MEMKELLKQGIKEALDKAIDKGLLPQGEYPDVELEVPPQKKFGDFATNIAMKSARVAHCAPRNIAEAIIGQMQYDWLDKAEIAGAGFINFFLKNTVIYDTLKQILKAGSAYGKAPLREDDTVQVEYVSANPTGPLHVVMDGVPRMEVPLSICCVQQGITYRLNITSTMPVTRWITWQHRSTPGI